MTLILSALTSPNSYFAEFASAALVEQATDPCVSSLMGALSVPQYIATLSFENWCLGCFLVNTSHVTADCRHVPYLSHTHRDSHLLAEM